MAKETAEYSFGGETRGVTIEMGSSEGEKINHTPDSKVGFDTDDIQEPEVALEENQEEVSAPVDGEEHEEAADALPDFNPEDPDVIAQYDSKFLTADGELDAEGALSAEYFANVEAGTDGLNEATYEYLATKGISKATVKQIEAMAATARDAEKIKAEGTAETHDAKLFEIAGGPDELQKALQWGKEGGYSKEQQERFNKASSGKDFEAKQEAVEALMARYRRANPTQKPKIPARDATKGQGKTVAQGAKPFANRAEMRTARDSLRDNDQKGWAAFQTRLSASSFAD